MNASVKIGTPSAQAARPFFNNRLMRRAMWFWFVEIGFSAVNFFILINLVYDPAWGNPLAHQVGMATRIAYIFILTYFMLRGVKDFIARDLLMVGAMWMGAWLVFEWGGSLAVGRPVSEILIGWNIFKGYMWPYVLLAYLFASLIVGSIMLRSREYVRRKETG
jgi:hypothetical protein